MDIPLLSSHLKISSIPSLPSLSARSSNILKLALVITSLFLTGFYLFSGSSDGAHRDYKQIYHGAISGKKAAFIDPILTSEIDGPFDNSTLAQLCASRKWSPGLIFMCEAPQGGVANVRNVFLNCVRYAIEAGGSYLPLQYPLTLPFPKYLN